MRNVVGRRSLGLLLALWTTVALADDAEDIRQVFGSYRAALLAGQGEAAAVLLSRSTHAYYDEMRRLALFGDAASVQRLSMVDQINVLLLRLRIPVDELERLSPQELIVHAVNQGWIGKNGVSNTQAGEVLTEGDVAVVHAIVGGRDAGPMFRFNREDGAWRLDLVPTMRAVNAALQTAAQAAGVSEQQFMLGAIGSVVGRRVGPEAWVPPRPPK
jgi:hypothetical protein